MKTLHSLLFAITLLVGSLSVAAAQDFSKGLEAYHAGDYQAALQEWLPLAEQGDAGAQYNLGHMYFNGNGVPQDYAESAKWYRLAAEQGNAAAQNNLGLNYLMGDGVLQSIVLAHMWANIASANGASGAGEWRDDLASQMTNADISEAQRMARECMSSNYQNCGQ